MADTVDIAFTIDFDNAETEPVDCSIHFFDDEADLGKLNCTTDTPIRIGDKVIGYVHEAKYESGSIEYGATAVNILGRLEGEFSGILSAAMSAYTAYTTQENTDPNSLI